MTESVTLEAMMIMAGQPYQQNQILLNELCARFPEVGPERVWGIIQQCQNNRQKCIEELGREIDRVGEVTSPIGGLYLNSPEAAEGSLADGVLRPDYRQRSLSNDSLSGASGDVRSAIPTSHSGNMNFPPANVFEANHLATSPFYNYAPNADMNLYQNQNRTSRESQPYFSGQGQYSHDHGHANRPNTFTGVFPANSGYPPQLSSTGSPSSASGNSTPSRGNQTPLSAHGDMYGGPSWHPQYPSPHTSPSQVHTSSLFIDRLRSPTGVSNQSLPPSQQLQIFPSPQRPVQPMHQPQYVNQPGQTPALHPASYPTQPGQTPALHQAPYTPQPGQTPALHQAPYTPPQGQNQASFHQPSYPQQGQNSHQTPYSNQHSPFSVNSGSSNSSMVPSLQHENHAQSVFRNNVREQNFAQGPITLWQQPGFRAGEGALNSGTVLHPARHPQVTCVSADRNSKRIEDSKYLQTLLEHQRQRMEKLQEDLRESQGMRDQLQSEVAEMEQSMRARRNSKSSLGSISAGDCRKLKQDNRKLQIDIQLLTREIDLVNNGQTPLGVLDAHELQSFYHNLDSGPQVSSSTSGSSTKPDTPPPRPPPRGRAQSSGSNICPVPSIVVTPPERRSMSPATMFSRPTPGVAQRSPQAATASLPTERGQGQPGNNGGFVMVSEMDDDDSLKWGCTQCTFLNHQLINLCEMCDHPRI